MMTRSLVGFPSVYDRILKTVFPQNYAFSFAYGSGVLKQGGKNNQSRNMIDLIIAVENSTEWHKENIVKNSSHYSALKYLGPKVIANYQEKWGAKVYFNTLVPLVGENIMIKYGVVSKSDIITDLLDWSDLYVAGRLHKPVEIIHKASDTELRSALQQNLHSAVHAALLLLPENFIEIEFYLAISRLSYAGDFRMIFGEDKNKIQNIVVPQIKAFQDFYDPVIKSLSDYVYICNSDDASKKCCQDINSIARHHHLNQLPRTPQRAMVRMWNKGRGKLRQDTEDALRAMAYDTDCSEILDRCVKDIVWTSSIKQSLKGIVTAGFVKSVRYSWKKIVKMLLSMNLYNRQLRE